MDKFNEHHTEILISLPDTLLNELNHAKNVLDISRTELIRRSLSRDIHFIRKQVQRRRETETKNRDDWINSMMRRTDGREDYE